MTTAIRSHFTRAATAAAKAGTLKAIPVPAPAPSMHRSLAGMAMVAAAGAWMDLDKLALVRPMAADTWGAYAPRAMVRLMHPRGTAAYEGTREAWEAVEAAARAAYAKAHTADHAKLVRQTGAAPGGMLPLRIRMPDGGAEVWHARIVERRGGWVLTEGYQGDGHTVTHAASGMAAVQGKGWDLPACRAIMEGLAKGAPCGETGPLPTIPPATLAWLRQAIATHTVGEAIPAHP